MSRTIYARAIEDDLFNDGVYRDADMSIVDEIRSREAIKDEADQILSGLGVTDYRNFYKNIYEDITATKRDLRKATKEEKARIKAARQAGREAQAKTKEVRAELKRFRNAEVAALKRANRKAETRIKKNAALSDELEGQRHIALDGFFDVTGPRGESIDDYVKEAVDEITNNLSQLNPDPSIPAYIAPVARGPLKEKLLDVKDVDFEDFLDNDIQNVMQYYRHHMGTQIELKRNFGNIDLKEQIQQIKDDYTRRLDEATNPKERKALAKEMKQTMRDVEGVRDILLGRYNLSDPDTWYNQAATVIKDIQYMSKMGGVLISSFPDMFRGMMYNGLDNVLPKFDNKEITKMIKASSKEDLEEAGLLLETTLASRLQSLADIGDPLNRGTALTRFTGNAAQTFSKVTLINYWNDWQKGFSALGTQRRIIKGLSSTDKNEIGFLRGLGIDAPTARVIKEQIAKHGDDNLSGLKNWDMDVAGVAEAARIYRAALRKSSDISIVTKGAGDLPLVSNTVGGRLLLQFKSFLIASHSRVLLRSLQSRGGREVSGAVMGATAMVGMGMLVAAIKAELHERSTGLRGVDNNFDISSWNRRKWILEGVDRSGLIALMLEPMMIADKASGLGPSMLTGQGQTSRYASRNVLGALLGPTAGTIGDVGVTTRMLASPLTGADIAKSDIYAFRRIMPFQNAFIFRQMFDILEREAGEAINAK